MTEKDIENCDDIMAAVSSTETSDKARQSYIIQRAIHLGCVEHIPREWEVKLSER